MKLKKQLSLFLALLMIVSAFSGCGQGKKDSGNNGEEPTVLTFASTYKMQSEPIPWYETKVFKKILEEANVKIEYIDYDTEQFNLMLSSGEVPDIVYSTVGDKIDDVVTSGIALDMWPLLEEYAPNMLLDVYSQRNELVRMTKGGDKQALYFVAPRINTGGLKGTEIMRGYNVRWDYYLDIGAPEITDDDVFIEIIEKMVEAHPTNEKGEKTYGMAVFDNYLYWYMRASHTKPVSTQLGTFSGTQYSASFVTGDLVNGYTQTENTAFWTDMKFYNKLYNKGLLDPDSFTMTAQEYSAKHAAGRYVATQYNDAILYMTTSAADPDTLVGFANVPSPNIVAEANQTSLLGYFPGYYLFISKNSKNWEAALRLFNVLHDPDTQRMLWAGIEGDSWNYVDGVPTLTDEMKAMLAAGNDELRAYGILNAKTAFATLENNNLHPDGYPIDLTELEDVKVATLNPLQKSQAEHYGVDYPMQATMKLVEEGKIIDLRDNYSKLIAANTETKPTDIARIVEKCNDILYRAVPELVMAASEAEFEKAQEQVLKDLKDAGEAQAWDWYQEQYNASKKVIQPIIDQSK